MHLALTRRAVATALLSLPALTIHPQRAAAGLFGDDGPQGSFRDLTLARIRLNELVGKLESTELKGDEPDDAIVVLQTLTVQFGGTVKLLAKTTEAMTLLGDDDRQKAVEAAERVQKELDEVRQGGREKSAGRQLGGAKDASKALGDYLAVAGTKYNLPSASDAVGYGEYSKDPGEFAAQYYGFFSCEGQGLDRVPGSNTCKNSATKKNINPLPTAPLLEFDFLTGKERPDGRTEKK